MIRKAAVGLALFLLAVPLLADKKLDDRMMHAASILQEIRGSLDEEAHNVLNDAYAVAVFPEFVKVGLFGGVKHGRGVLAKRLDSGDWSKPAFVRITSGSFGLQFGVSLSQLLIVFKDPKAVEAISGGQFTIGADAAYAAGELGGMAAAGTDNRFENQIVALARSKGLFAGVALEGGVLRIEKDSNIKFYNDAIGLDGRTLLEDTEVETPPVAQHFRIVVAQSVPALSEGVEPARAGHSDVGTSALDNGERSLSSGPADSPAARSAAGPGGETLSQSSLVPAHPAGSPAAVQAPYRQSFANAGVAPTGAAPAVAAPMPEETPESMWFTPNGQEFSSGGSGANDTNTRSSLGSRLTGKLASRARDALWDGTKDLAGNAIRNNAEAQGARVATKVGGKVATTVGGKVATTVGGKVATTVGGQLVDRAIMRPGIPGLPSSTPAQAAATGQTARGQTAPGQWVEVPDDELQLASASSQPFTDASQAFTDGSQPLMDASESFLDASEPLANVEAVSPGALRDAVSGTAGPSGASFTGPSGAGFTGPPSPSEWPKEWLQQQAVAGACVQGS